jgi:hypothetical protein
MSNEHKEWLREQSFESLADDNLRIKLELKTAKEENEKLNKLHAFLHNKFNWSKEDVWIRNYLSSYIFNEEMVSDGKEYISPIKQISDLTQQNKQMREALSWLEALLRENYNDKENQIICVVFAYEKIQQALNQLKGGE